MFYYSLKYSLYVILSVKMLLFFMSILREKIRTKGAIGYEIIFSSSKIFDWIISSKYRIMIVDQKSMGKKKLLYYCYQVIMNRVKSLLKKYKIHCIFILLISLICQNLQFENLVANSPRNRDYTHVDSSLHIQVYREIITYPQYMKYILVHKKHN